jgi:hypothetical protein
MAGDIRNIATLRKTPNFVIARLVRVTQFPSFFAYPKWITRIAREKRAPG